MANIVYVFPIKSSRKEVFEAVSTPKGLDAWWTKRASGEPAQGAEYELWFGPDYDWRAVVSRCQRESEFELQMTAASTNWNRTRVGFLLEYKGGVTQVQFHHSDWPALNDHYKVSSFCWAMYLRLLKRYVELGEVIPYEGRPDA